MGADSFQDALNDATGRGALYGCLVGLALGGSVATFAIFLVALAIYV